MFIHFLALTENNLCEFSQWKNKIVKNNKERWELHPRKNILQVHNKMQSPPWSKQHHGANKLLYSCPEDKKLRQKSRKMSSELINLIHFRSPFIYSHICNCIRLLTSLLLKNPYFLISSEINIEQKKLFTHNAFWKLKNIFNYSYSLSVLITFDLYTDTFICKYNFKVCFPT